MSYIIAISSSKGGPGKTNTVANLADYWALKGKKVAMLDSDPNKNLSKWYNKKALDDAFAGVSLQTLEDEEQIIDAAEAAAQEHDIVLIDVAGVRSRALLYAAGIADLVIVPAQPSEDDIDEAINTIEAVKSAGKLAKRDIKYRVLLSQTRKGTIVLEHAAKQFEEINNIKIFATITNTLAKDKSINDSWRKLPTPISARNLSNVVEDSVVDSLVSSVIEYYPKLSHRYYALKAKWFKKKYLMYWDRNAPLPFQNSKTFSWKEAQHTVVDAYSEFNSNIGNIVKKFFDEKWIHAPVLEGKSPGAFAASTVASVHPFILVNFQGKTRDVSTLAHELGHGVHQYLAGKNQTHFNASTPLTLAETASVFGEMLTFKLILNQTTSKKERKALLANKVEDMLNTVIRQIAFFQFEKEIHTLRRNSELSIDKICSIWMDVQKASLGPSIKYEEEYKYYWSYIPHFIHSPFYVYAYAFGDCLVNSLFNTYEQGLMNFDDKYINLLKSGGSKKYDELFRPFNLNLSKKSFWKKGLHVIEGFIDELETL